MPARSRPAIRAITAVLTGCVLLGGCAAAGSSSTSSGSGATSPSARTVTTYPAGRRPSIPVVSGTTLTGSRLALSSLRGHVVVLNAWASWCEPCRGESPALARIARRTAPLGVRFVGLDEEDRTGAARAFAKKAGTTYPSVIDSDGRLLGTLRLVPPAAIPSTLVLDPTGRVAARVVGAIDETSFEALLRSLATGEVQPPTASAAA